MENRYHVLKAFGYRDAEGNQIFVTPQLDSTIDEVLSPEEIEYRVKNGFLSDAENVEGAEPAATSRRSIRPTKTASESPSVNNGGNS